VGVPEERHQTAQEKYLDQVLINRGKGNLRACVIEYRSHGYSWHAIAAIIARIVNAGTEQDRLRRNLNRWFNDDPDVLAAEQHRHKPRTVT